jgi:PAS domain S-box-containing protein
MIQQANLIHKRNQCIIYIYLAFILIYITAVMLHFISLNKPFIISSSLFLIFYLLLKNSKIPVRFIQFYIISFMNVLILLLISKSFYILNLYSFIFYLILVGLYLSSKILIVSSFIVLIEIYLITFIFSLDSHTTFKHLSPYLIVCSIMLLIGVNLLTFIQYNLSHYEKDLKKKQQKAISKNAYLQLFFEYANDAIAVFDLNNKVIEVNPAFEKLYGWTKEECIGNSLPLVPPKNINEMEERFKKLLNGKSYTAESEEMKKDGTVFKAQISLSPIFNKEGKVLAVSVISRDISYMKKHERLQMQSEKLKLAGEIAAGVAHEIRNPMTVISGFAQMMQEDSDSPYQSYIQIVQDEIERINLIISEFLILSKPQIKDKGWVNLVTVIEEIATFFKLEFKAKNVQFTFKSDIDEAFIFGNKNQLKQVFINLLKNSMEAIQDSGTIDVEILKQENSYRISIKDNGTGIPEEVLERIFEPFYTTKVKGTGLGMMIINKIVQDHFGSIKVFSKVNVGTDIHIQLSTKYEE